MRKYWILCVLGVGLLLWAAFAATESLKRSVTADLRRALKREVTVQGATLIFPAGIRLTGITIPQGSTPEGVPYGSIQQLGIRLTLGSFLQGRPGVDLELIRPRIFFRGQLKGLAGRLPSRSAFKRGGFLFNRLRVRDGEIILVDQRVTPPVEWRVKDLSVSVRSGPQPGGYSYSILGDWQDESHQPQGNGEASSSRSHEQVGKLQVNGQLLADRTIRAKVSFSHDKLEDLAPYARRLLGAAPARGAVQISGTVTLKQGELSADTELTASGVRFATEEPTLLGPPGNRLAELLQDRSGQIRIPFPIKGSLQGQGWADLLTVSLKEALRQELARGIQRALTEAEPPRSVEEFLRRESESSPR